MVMATKEKPKKRKLTLANNEALVDDIVDSLSRHVKTFGGDRPTNGSLIQDSLKGRSPMFALGVDVKAVVRYVLNVADAKLLED
jgi:hypothetical protein